MKPRVLVVEDEAATLDLLEFTLREAGFEVLTAKDGFEAFRLARTTAPQMIVLDLMLPGLGGIEVCELLRRSRATAYLPLVCISGKASEEERIRSYEAGFDDYIAKPFSQRELVLRVKKLLRSPRGGVEKAETFRFGALVIDIPAHEVTWKGTRLALTATEFQLLTFLAGRDGRVASREKLLREVWAQDGLQTSRTVDTHVRRLRQKLGAACKYLETVRGTGYRLRAQ